MPSNQVKLSFEPNKPDFFPPAICMHELKTSLLSIYYDSSLSGVYTAAHDLDIEWTVIKGISGYADGRNESNSWRPFASLMAASLTAHILSDAIPFQAMRHYRNKSKYWACIHISHNLSHSPSSAHKDQFWARHSLISTSTIYHLYLR